MKLGVLIACCLGAIAPSAVAIGADIYVHATAGDDNGPCTAELPCRTLGRATSLVLSGDTVHLAGKFSGGVGASTLNIGGRSDVVIKQWVGQAQCYVSNSVVIAGGEAWSAATEPRYQTSLPSGLSIQTICLSFGDPAARDVYGRYKVHLRKSTDGAAVQTPNTFDYDAATGVLSVNIRGENFDPDTFACPLEYCLAGTYAGGNGIIRAENCTNCTIRGIKGRNYILTNQPGYFVFMSGSGNVIEDCEFFGCGWHHVGFVASGPSAANANNTIRRCTFWGGGAGIGTTAGTQTTFYANGGNVVNGLIEDCEYHCYKMLDPEGVEWGNAEMHGSYAHTSSGVFTTELKHRRCRFYSYTDTRGAYGSNQRVPAENAEAQFEAVNYSLQYEDCEFVARHAPGWVGARGLFFSEAAYIRCLFVNMTLKEDRVSGSGYSRAMHPELTSIRHLQTLFESCHLVFDLSGGSGPSDAGGIRFLSGPTGRSTICFLNTAVVNNNSASGIPSSLLISNAANGTGVIRARGSVFCASRIGPMRPLIDDAGMPSANCDFQDCWYFGVDPEHYSGNPAINSASEWLTTIDPDAVLNVDPGYFPPSVPAGAMARPMGSAEVLLRTSTAARRSTMGINLQPDRLRYGPWQADAVLPPTPCELADFNGVDGVNADDIFAFLDAWFVQNGLIASGLSADINRDEQVNADDIFAFLDVWFAQQGVC